MIENIEKPRMNADERGSDRGQQSGVERTLLSPTLRPGVLGGFVPLSAFIRVHPRLQILNQGR